MKRFHGGPVNCAQLEELEFLERAIQGNLKTLEDLEMPLDPKIKEIVYVLTKAGIHTFQSCQGGDGHPFREPTVSFNGDSWEGFKAFAIAKANGFNVLSVSYEYGEVDGWLEGPSWMMTFRDTTRK